MEEYTLMIRNEIVSNTGLWVNRYHTLFTIFYTQKEVCSYSDAIGQDLKIFQKIYPGLLDKGILLPPSLFETSFLSLKHTGKDIQNFIRVFSKEFSVSLLDFSST